MTGRRCPGLHCPGCHDGGGLVALMVALAVIGAVLHAIWHAIVEAAEILALTVLGIIGLAAVAGIGYVVLRIRASIIRSRAQAGPQAVIAGEVIHGSISISHPSAIAPALGTSWPLPGKWEESGTVTASPAGTDHAPGHPQASRIRPLHRL